MPTDRGAWLPEREFRYVVTEFSLDPGHAARRSGYRPVWRLTVPGEEPVLVGLCALALVEKDRIEPGETQVVQWVFVPGVQGYIEHLSHPAPVPRSATGRAALAPCASFGSYIEMSPLQASLEANRRGRMGWRQRARFFAVGLVVIAIPGGLAVEIAVIARNGGVHVGPANVFVLFGLLPLLILVFVPLGFVACLEGIVGKCRITVGIPTRPMLEVRSTGRLRRVVIDGGTAPVPARDYDRVVGSGLTVRIYRSRIMRGYLGWEYAAEGGEGA